VLGATAVENVTERRLVLPSGELFGGGQAVGRGAVPHLFARERWYCADMRTLP